MLFGLQDLAIALSLSSVGMCVGAGQECPAAYALIAPRRGARVQDGFVARLNLGRDRHVVISERMRGSNDSAGLTSVGVDADSLDMIVLKDRVHHRAFWDQVDCPVDAPGIGQGDLAKLECQNVPPGVYPMTRKQSRKYPSRRRDTRGRAGPRARPSGSGRDVSRAR